MLDKQIRKGILPSIPNGSVKLVFKRRIAVLLPAELDTDTPSDAETITGQTDPTVIFNAQVVLKKGSYITRYGSPSFPYGYASGLPW